MISVSKPSKHFTGRHGRRQTSSRSLPVHVAIKTARLKPYDTVVAWQSSGLVPIAYIRLLVSRHAKVSVQNIYWSLMGYLARDALIQAYIEDWQNSCKIILPQLEAYQRWDIFNYIFSSLYWLEMNPVKMHLANKFKTHTTRGIKCSFAQQVRDFCFHNWESIRQVMPSDATATCAAVKKDAPRSFFISDLFSNFLPLNPQFAIGRPLPRWSRYVGDGAIDHVMSTASSRWRDR